MATICKFLASDSGNGKKSAVIELTIKGNQPRRIVIEQQQVMVLNFGDRIKCLEGKLLLMINPGTPSGVFILSKHIPQNADWKCRTQIEINQETTKIIHRGSISVKDDIGAVLTSAGSFSR